MMKKILAILVAATLLVTPGCALFGSNETIVPGLVSSKDLGKVAIATTESRADIMTRLAKENPEFAAQLSQQETMAKLYVDLQKEKLAKADNKIFTLKAKAGQTIELKGVEELTISLPSGLLDNSSGGSMMAFSQMPQPAAKQVHPAWQLANTLLSVGTNGLVNIKLGQQGVDRAKSQDTMWQGIFTSFADMKNPVNTYTYNGSFNQGDNQGQGSGNNNGNTSGNSGVGSGDNRDNRIPNCVATSGTTAGTTTPSTGSPVNNCGG